MKRKSNIDILIALPEDALIRVWHSLNRFAWPDELPNKPKWWDGDPNIEAIRPGEVPARRYAYWQIIAEFIEARIPVKKILNKDREVHP